MSNYQINQIPSINSENCTLKLLKSHIKKTDQEQASATRNLSHFYKLLKTKNQKNARQIKHVNLQHKTLTVEESRKLRNFDETRRKVFEQLEVTKQYLLRAADKRKVNDKRKKMFEENEQRQILQKSKRESTIINVCDHFQKIGWNEAVRLAKKLNIRGENKQDTNSLIVCFEHLLNDDQPIMLFNRNNISQKKLQLNLCLYSAVLTQIIKFNLQENSKENSLINKIPEILTKFPNQVKANSYFQTIMNHLSLIVNDKQSNNISPKNQQRDKLYDYLQNYSSKDRRYDGELKEQMLWQKLFYLIKKKEKYHSLIIIHLQQFNYHDLSIYFKNIIKGKNIEYVKDLRLYNSNIYYKKFMLILQRRYLEYCWNQNEEIQQSQILPILMKEIYLKQLFHQNCENEMAFFKKYSSQLSKKFRLQINAKTKFQQVQVILIRLLYLCQYAPVLEILLDYQKMNELQVLIILSIAAKLEDCYYYLFLYDKYSTFLFTETLFKKIARNTHQNHFYEFSMLLKAFYPLLNHLNDQTQYIYIDILCEKKQLFQQIIQNEGYIQFCKQINLSFRHLSMLLESLIQKHSCYAYCTQLGVSVCLSLDKFKINSRKSSDKLDSLSNKINNQNSDKFKEKSRYWIIGFNQQKQKYFNQVNNKQKMNFLLKVVQRVININIELSTNYQKRQIFHEEVYFCNQLLFQLKNKELVQFLWINLDILQSQQKTYSERLYNQLKCLLFTFNVLKLRICIENGQFQQIIHLFNNYIQEISSSTELIIDNLDIKVEQKYGKRLYLNYLGQLVQSIILLNRQKKKVVIRNRYLFRVMCKIINDQIKNLRQVDKEQVLLIENYLQRTLNDIINV